MKASGSIESLLQGVSQQIPGNRGPGQHTAQTNMMPDPVRGLARRHGTLFVAESQTGLDPNLFATMVADTANYRSFNYSNAGHDYTVLYRCAAVVAGSTLPVVTVFDRTTNTFLPLSRAGSDPQLDLLVSGGVSAITSIGKYVFMAGFSTASTSTTTNLWTDANNIAASVVWIRGGAYARTFSVTVTKTDNSKVTFSYTTPTSSFTGTLDTTGVAVYAADPAGGTQADTEAAYIPANGTAKLGWGAWAPTALSVKTGSTVLTNVFPSAPANSGQYSWSTGQPTIQFHSSLAGSTTTTITYTHTKVVANPNYAKTVNDITNAYNSSVTQWIASAAAAIAPAAIAQSLLAAAVSAGLGTATVNGSTIIFDNVLSMVVSDGGDGSLIRGVAQTVSSINEVSDIHKVGKVVQVRAVNSAESFYLKATAKDPSITSGYTEVVWVEGAALKYTITNALIYLTVSGGVAYIGSSAAIMNSLIGGLNAPDYVASKVGDQDSSPLPYFVGKTITYLGVFQDRLLIGAGAVLRASRTADYLNFFRQTTLSVLQNDTIETLSQGSDDDTLRYSVFYGKDLVIFGDKRQYLISGRSTFSPVAPNMSIMSSTANAAQLPPLAVGDVIFYGQLGEIGAAVFQVQPGLTQDTPESYLASSQLDSYIGGSIIELAYNPKPAHLLARATGDRSTLYCFTYLDKAQTGRVQDAWHKLTFDPILGAIIGMTQVTNGVLVYFLRKAVKFDGSTKVYLCCDLLTFTTQLATKPYVDSLRPWSQVATNTGSVHTASVSAWKVAFDNSTAWFLQGGLANNYAELTASFPSASGAWVGADMPTLWSPTNPFIKDKNSKVITSGRLTVTSFNIAIEDSSGFYANTVGTSREGNTLNETVLYDVRLAGSQDNLSGIEVVTDTTVTVPIALPNTDFLLNISAHNWLPLTITQVDWVGQWFSRTQRF